MLNKIFGKQLWHDTHPAAQEDGNSHLSLVFVFASLVFENAVFYPKKD